MLKTSRLQPPSIGGSLQEVVGVLALVVNPWRTRSLALPAQPVHRRRLQETPIEISITTSLKSLDRASLSVFSLQPLSIRY